MKTQIIRNVLLCTVFLHMLTLQCAAADVHTPEMSGFMTMSCRTAPGMNSGMEVDNVRIRVRGDIDSTTEYTFFVDALHTDILLDAAICRTIMPSLTVTAGQFKTPFSTDNLLPAWKYPFIARGYLKRAVSPPFRDIGVQITHSTKYLELTTAIMNGAGGNTAETNGDKAVTCRAVTHVAGWLALSGQYSRGVFADDGEMTAFYNAGVSGSTSNIWYNGEYAHKEHAGIRSRGVAAWISYDWRTGSVSLPILTPAFKCEWYTPDCTCDDGVTTCCTAGLSIHLTKKDTNRIMMNYVRESTKSSHIEERIGITCLVRFR